MIRYFFILTVAAFIPNFAWAAGDAKDHAHAHSEGNASSLRLNRGKPWATDAPLRKGMEQIRKAVEADLPGIHDGSADAASYERLASGVEREIQAIFKNCKLAPEADAQLHVVIIQMLRGTERMKKNETLDDRHLGAIEIVKALRLYGKHFAHPGWKNPGQL